MNKTALVNEVKGRLGVSTARARTVVDTVFEEMAHALEQGQSLSLRGLGFTPANDRIWSEATDSVTSPSTPARAPGTAPAGKTAATKSPGAAPAKTPTPTEPHVVPYEPMHDPAADALAAVAAEQQRPAQPDEPWDQSTRVVATMPEPELQAEPDTLAYSTGEADTDESIGDLTGGQQG